MPSSLYHQPGELTLPDQPPFSPCQGWAASSAERQSNGNSEAAQKNSCASLALHIPASKDNRGQDPFAVSHPGTGRSVHPWSGTGLPGSWHVPCPVPSLQAAPPLTLPSLQRQRLGQMFAAGRRCCSKPISLLLLARVECVLLSHPAFSLPRNRHFFEEIIGWLLSVSSAGYTQMKM